MKKAVAHLIPFMDKERQDRLAQRKAEGCADEDEVDVSVAKHLENVAMKGLMEVVGGGRGKEEGPGWGRGSICTMYIQTMAVHWTLDY